MVLVALAGPLGEFAVNDDFSYAWTTRNWLETGGFRPHDWTSMPLVAQAAWGALWSLVAGFSHTTLRLSTIVCGLLAVVAQYALARELGARRGVAALVASSLAVCPLLVPLSVTFMTDVPFLAAMLGGCFAAVRWLRTGSPAALVGLLLAGVAATLTRQLGLALGVGVLVLSVRGERRLRGALLLLVTGAALVALHLWLDVSDTVPEQFRLRERQLRGVFDAGIATPVAAAERLSLVVLYAGLFGLPLWLPYVREVARRRYAPLTVGCALLCVGSLVRVGRWMPALPHWVGPDGLGPPKLLGEEALPSLPVGVLMVVTLVSVVGAAAVVVGCVRAWRSGSEAPRLLLVVVGAYLLPILPTAVFDRYLLLPVALLPLVARTGLRRSTPVSDTRRWAVAAPALLLFACVSAAGTHDLLAWNRAAWRAADQLVAEGVSPWEIDGGFAWNGWHLSEELPADRPRTAKSWWWVEDDRHIVSFAPLDGYEVLWREPVERLLPGPDLYVLRRVE